VSLPLALLKVVAKALLNAAGDAVRSILPEAARLAWEWWQGERMPQEQRAEVLALANPAPPPGARCEPNGQVAPAA
jgi:hypothetical protein